MTYPQASTTLITGTGRPKGQRPSSVQTTCPKGQPTYEADRACPKGQVVQIDVESGCPKGQADHEDQATCPKGQPQRGDVPKDKAIRPWIKVRLGRTDLDVQPIIDQWTSQRKGALNVATAIRLYDAILRGDLDAVREICPLLVALVGTSQEAPADPPVLDSDSVNQISTKAIKDSEGESVAAAIVEVTGFDYKLNKSEIDKLAGQLVKGDYTADDIRRWYSGWWCLKDWRGRDRGERPKPKDIQQLIARVRELPPVIDQAPPAAAQTPAVNPYLVGVPDYDLEELPAPAATRPQAVRNDWWLALMMQLENQLNHGTFQEWIKRLLLVGVEHGDDGVTYRVLAPDRYVVDRVDQHYRQLMEKVLSNFNNKPVRLALSEAA